MPQSNVVRLIEKSWRPPRIDGEHLVAAGLGLDRLGVRARSAPGAGPRRRRGGRSSSPRPSARPGARGSGRGRLEELVLGVVGLARHAIEALVGPEVDVVPAVLVDRVQELAHRRRVPGLRGADVVVVGDVEACPDLAPLGLHVRPPTPARSCRAPRPPAGLQPVLVGAGEVEDLLAAEPVVPGDEVGGHGVVARARCGARRSGSRSAW